MLCVGRKIILCIAATTTHEQCVVNGLRDSPDEQVLIVLGSIEPHNIGVWIAGAPHREWRLLVAWCGFFVIAVANYNGSQFDELVQYLDALATKHNCVSSKPNRCCNHAHFQLTTQKTERDEPLSSCQTSTCGLRRSYFYSIGTTLRCANLDTERYMENSQ